MQNYSARSLPRVLNGVSVPDKLFNKTPLLSIVVPVFNESPNIKQLIEEIRVALDSRLEYEVIYVDDGSTDDTLAQLQTVAQCFHRLRIIRHPRSYGQSVATLSGVKAARAEWIVTLDGDGQNDPADILRLLEVLGRSNRPPRLHLVAGQRRKRMDNRLRRFSSRLANHIRSFLLHDNTLDTGCSLKLFSRNAFLNLPHFNHMHRFLPALFLRGGGQIILVEVSHRPRLQGESKYGVFNRLWVGIVDLLGVMWLQRRRCDAEVVEETQNDKK